MLIWLLALACKDPVIADTGVADTGKFENLYEQDSDCAELWLDIDGPEDPAIGDSWTVWMKCDGALLLGTIYMRFDPPEIATVDLNTAVFVEPTSISQVLVCERSPVLTEPETWSEKPATRRREAFPWRHIPPQGLSG